jgi:hypothetical protein
VLQSKKLVPRCCSAEVKEKPVLRSCSAEVLQLTKKVKVEVKVKQTKPVLWFRTGAVIGA